jgi:DNA-binding transcriptional MerR regulator
VLFSAIIASMPNARRSTAKAESLTLEQVEADSGVPGRTLRRWMRLGLLPGPLGAGRASHYEATHVLRARAIDALRGQRLSLRAIRDKLAVASVQELAKLSAPRTSVASQGPVPPPAPSYPSTTWERVELSDALVLLIRADSAAARRLADDIYRHYRA